MLWQKLAQSGDKLGHSDCFVNLIKSQTVSKVIHYSTHSPLFLSPSMHIYIKKGTPPI